MDDFILLRGLGLPNGYAGLSWAKCTDESVATGGYRRECDHFDKLFTVWLQGCGAEPSLYRHGSEEDAQALFDDLAARAKTYCSRECRVELWRHQISRSSDIDYQVQGDGRIYAVTYRVGERIARVASTVSIKGLGP